jgi:hypothetical protein
MIMAELAVDMWQREDESDIIRWCRDTFGPKAEFRDQVDENHRWCQIQQFRYYVFYFAEESDATMFALRWL